jgi:von Willebrand factor type A domain
MPLEATMIVLDNSEYMRNGDYQPTRFGALADAVTTVFQTKIDSNPENTVGVMTMANKGCALISHEPIPIPSHHRSRSNEFSISMGCTYQA